MSWQGTQRPGAGTTPGTLMLPRMVTGAEATKKIANKNPQGHKGYHKVTKRGASPQTLEIPHLPQGPGARGWWEGRELQREGQACPAFLGGHTKQKPVGSIPLLGVATTRGGRSEGMQVCKTGCLQSSWEGRGEDSWRKAEDEEEGPGASHLDFPKPQTQKSVQLCSDCPRPVHPASSG